MFKLNESSLAAVVSVSEPSDKVPRKPASTEGFPNPQFIQSTRGLQQTSHNPQQYGSHDVLSII